MSSKQYSVSIGLEKAKTIPIVCACMFRIGRISDFFAWKTVYLYKQSTIWAQTKITWGWDQIQATICSQCSIYNLHQNSTLDTTMLQSLISNTCLIFMVYCAKILFLNIYIFTLIWQRQERALLILSNYKQYLHITKIWVHQVHILCRDRVHICTHFSIMLFMATSYFMLKHALKMIYLKYMHILKEWVQICTRFYT